ncbi:hypothetical protein NLJ89_g10313 [Agrocybe chaxingu]|uniref:F-box domain-containing protein n=1 Tax=Agrocybe chaxingu TaxID=84603 RepID=A0A9W8MS91_9AGAR|nr:hypothetical protein NLJ89_g10313 [Agrocybe chaxingu]
MPDLPPEIWCTVALYLPNDALKELYAVNRAFFDLAMNERYREVSFRKINESVMRQIEALRSPSIACRVHSLRFVPGFLPGLSANLNEVVSPERRRMPHLSNLSSISRRITHRFTKNRSRGRKDESDPVCLTQLADGLMDVLPLMLNVRDLRLSWDSFSDVHSPPLDLAWSTFGPNLQSLTLSMSTTKFLSMFPLSRSPLPCLRLFSVEICARGYADDRNMGGELLSAEIALAGFVSSLSGSLEHLTVSCCPPEYLSVFYKHVLPLKSLSSLTFDMASLGRQYSETSTSSGLNGFLRQQEGTLRHLEISASVSENPRWSSYRFSFHDLQLSSLRSLSVTADILSSSWDDSFAFLRNHVQLESLSINQPLAPSEIYRILDVLNHHHPSAALVELSLSMYNLDVRVLDKLASDLRRLRSLKVKISKVSCGTTYAITPSQHFPHDTVSGKVYPFVNEMKLHASFERWELKDITIRRRSCCADLLLWGLMSLCAQCIPSITSFAGNGDKAVPAEPQATHKRCFQVLCSYGTDHTLW